MELTCACACAQSLGTPRHRDPTATTRPIDTFMPAKKGESEERGREGEEGGKEEDKEDEIDEGKKGEKRRKRGRRRRGKRRKRTGWRTRTKRRMPVKSEPPSHAMPTTTVIGRAYVWSGFVRAMLPDPWYCAGGVPVPLASRATTYVLLVAWRG